MVPSLTRLVLLLTAAGLTPALAQSNSGRTVPLRWLDGAPPPAATGVSFGVPFSRGAMVGDQTFVLSTTGGRTLPVQTWPLARWPDGSLKWLGVATVAGPDAGALTLAVNGASTPPPAATADPSARIQTRRSDTTLEIDTGAMRCRLPNWGNNLIDSITVAGREVARQGQLVCILQDGPDGDPSATPAREKYSTKVEKVTLEQAGPVRAVVKIEGHHAGVRTSREWLPFVVRLTFYAGQEQIRMVHTIVYDGNEQKDFIRGLGVTFAVPLREQVQNRHVRFGGEGDGLWSEPIQPMAGRGGRFVTAPDGNVDVYPDQVAGKRVPDREKVSDRGQKFLADWAVWDAFKLAQPNADGFTVVKRTNAASAWIPAGAGKRASGFAFVGDVSGGLGISLKNFWQSYPASLDIENASTGAATLTAWLWSPEGPAMDMRHYDTRPHGLDSVYEDVQPGMSTPLGVARTSELTLFPTSGVPSKQDTSRLALAGARPAVLVCTPSYLHDAQAFGLWGLEDRSTPVKKAIEERLDATLNFYLTQPDQQNWYGFWDYGDVMHSHDDVRHVWRYDLGGMAWANSELGPDLWLWYSFLRSGRADVFRMAEAMTRHTGEVDCYHLGPFAGLGSRHNVRHWGCGAKEARISQAAYRRFYYYLTTDERTGDIMREVADADYKTVEFDPMRLAQPITAAEKKVAPTRVRLGPDWLAFLGNWMTEWERTGDTRWRDKILAGVESLSQMPLGLRTGKNLVFGYDPETGRLAQLSDEPGVYNLATIMGGAEVVFELNLMLDDERWHKLWLQYCRLYSAPREVVVRDMQTGGEGMDASFVRDGRLAAYVYTKTKNDAFAQAAVDALVRTGRGGPRGLTGPTRLSGPDVLKPVDVWPNVGTNGASQNGLETITMLGMVGDRLPAEFPPRDPRETGPRGNRGDRPAPATPPAPTTPPPAPKAGGN